MTELLGIIAAIVMTCSGSNSPCSMQTETRATIALEAPLPLEIPKPVQKPVSKLAAKVKPTVAASHKLVAEADPVVVNRPAKRKEVPIFIGAYY